jgi:hypothetical protein
MAWQNETRTALFETDRKVRPSSLTACLLRHSLDRFGIHQYIDIHSYSDRFLPQLNQEWEFPYIFWERRSRGRWLGGTRTIF